MTHGEMKLRVGVYPTSLLVLPGQGSVPSLHTNTHTHTHACTQACTLWAYLLNCMGAAKPWYLCKMGQRVRCSLYRLTLHLSPFCTGQWKLTFPKAAALTRFWNFLLFPRWQRLLAAASPECYQPFLAPSSLPTTL